MTHNSDHENWEEKKTDKLFVCLYIFHKFGSLKLILLSMCGLKSIKKKKKKRKSHLI